MSSSPGARYGAGDSVPPPPPGCSLPVEPAGPRRAGLGWLGWARPAAAAARGLPVPPSLPSSLPPLTHADPPALCEPRAGPGPAGRLRSPRAAVGEGRPGNGPADRPGPVRCGAVLVRSLARHRPRGPARSAHSSSAVRSLLRARWSFAGSGRAGGRGSSRRKSPPRGLIARPRVAGEGGSFMMNQGGKKKCTDSD